MAFSYRQFFFGGKTFCCCLPVRMGVIIMSFLSILLAGVLSVILWFEVASTSDLTGGEKASFVAGGLVETLLFIASMLGFVGAIVRKQLFVMIYAYFIYFHFVLNVAIAAWLLWMITHAENNDVAKACRQTIQDPDAQDQCVSLLKIAKAVYIVVASAVLLIEMYGAFIVARYVNQLKNEKRNARTSRVVGSESGFGLISSQTAQYSVVPGGQRALMKAREDPPVIREFDPYAEVGTSALDYSTPGPSYSYGSPPPLSEQDVGYGGGSWTYEQISAEEKERMKERDIQMGVLSPDGQQIDQQRADVKSVDGPPPLTKSTDDLPRYTLTDLPLKTS